jgi:hypothetical protein
MATRIVHPEYVPEQSETFASAEMLQKTNVHQRPPRHEQMAHYLLVLQQKRASYRLHHVTAAAASILQHIA